MYVRYSISFSVPRCRSPICGSARSTTSPSSSRTRRSTPWAAGCCGPKLIVKLRTAVSAISHKLRRGFCFIGDLGVETVPHHDDAFVTSLAYQVHSVMGADPEHNRAALHLKHLNIDRHGHARRGRRQMRDVNVRAETALARIEMFHEQLRTGPLHQHDHESRGEHSRHIRDDR